MYLMCVHVCTYVGSLKYLCLSYTHIHRQKTHTHTHRWKGRGGERERERERELKLAQYYNIPGPVHIAWVPLGSLSPRCV